MKKFFALTAVLVLLSAGSAFAVILGSSHDFSASGWTTEICAPCHTPHNAITGAGPLWSHATSGETFAMYTSPTINMTIGGAPGPISLACLSCHDGATNMDDFIGGPGAPSNPMGVTPANLGNDLTDDHPVAITYNAADEPLGYQPIATPQAAGLVFYGGASDQLECATCHDVHNQTAFTSMLRADPATSTICLACHIK